MKSPASEFSGKMRRLSARLWNPGDVRERRHRFSASLTGEEDWDPDQPQIRMSRAFAVMLILHLVAVGGLFAFHVFGKDEQSAEQNATRQAHAAATPAPPAPAPAPAPRSAPVPSSSLAAIPAGTEPPKAEVVPENTVTDKHGVQYQTHTVLPGETRILVAARYGISVRELEAANHGINVKPGVRLSIPVPPQRIISATPGAENTGHPPVAVIAATSLEEPGAREFVMKENPYQRDEHAAEEPIPAPRAAQVSAKPEKPAAGTSGKSPSRGAARDSGGQDRPVKTAKPKPSAPVTAGSRTHVVQKGDTVYNVANRYGLSPKEVMRFNGISDPGKLQLGQVLKIAVRH